MRTRVVTEVPVAFEAGASKLSGPACAAGCVTSPDDPSNPPADAYCSRNVKVSNSLPNFTFTMPPAPS
jgi:hypothetical protein